MEQWGIDIPEGDISPEDGDDPDVDRYFLNLPWKLTEEFAGTESAGVVPVAQMLLRFAFQFEPLCAPPHVEATMHEKIFKIPEKEEDPSRSLRERLTSSPKSSIPDFVVRFHSEPRIVGELKSSETDIKTAFTQGAVAGCAAQQIVRDRTEEGDGLEEAERQELCGAIVVAAVSGSRWKFYLLSFNPEPERGKPRFYHALIADRYIEPWSTRSSVYELSKTLLLLVDNLEVISSELRPPPGPPAPRLPPIPSAKKTYLDRKGPPTDNSAKGSGSQGRGSTGPSSSSRDAPTHGRSQGPNQSTRFDYLIASLGKDRRAGTAKPSAVLAQEMALLTQVFAEFRSPDAQFKDYGFEVGELIVKRGHLRAVATVTYRGKPAIAKQFGFNDEACARRELTVYSHFVVHRPKDVYEFVPRIYGFTYEVGSDSTGRVTLFMEALTSIFCLDKDKQKFKSRDWILDVCISAAEAVAWLHAQRICHNDISPNNFVLDIVRRKVKIIDFKFASCQEFGVYSQSQFPGTPGFVPDKREELGPARDCYCLGTTLRFWVDHFNPEFFALLRIISKLEVVDAHRYSAAEFIAEAVKLRDTLVSK
jgi:hypothetical protein